MTALNVELLTEKSSELADYITHLHFERDPGLIKRYGASGKKQCYEDAVFHLNFLAEAMILDLPDLYAEYILWAAAMLESRNIPQEDLDRNLNFVHQAIHEILGVEFSSATEKYAIAAKENLDESTRKSVSYITEDNPLQREVTDYLGYLLQGKRREATQLIAELIQDGVSIKDVYQFIFQVSQYELGLLWERNEVTVAHEHYCTAATQQIMSGLYQHVFASTRKGKTLVACSISGELHELGVRMVADYFEMDGWDTYYLGANMPDKQLQEALIEHRADVLALSVSLPIHVSKTAALIEKVRNNNKLINLKIIVGGHPFRRHPDLWEKVGADAFAQSASQAITKANNLVK